MRVASSSSRPRRAAARMVALTCVIGLALAIQFTPAPSARAAQATVPPNPEFLKAADEVLAQMSDILHLPIKQPLKKSLRSKQEIRAYLVQAEKDDKNDAQRYADDKALEAFGLIPRNFPLDSFMLDVLTDQVAGLYDPKAKEFYIADWIPADGQRDIMSHELTHALEDQSFDVDPWIKAARPDDDAELARTSVSEGSALAAMLDYSLREQHIGIRDIGDVTALIRPSALAEMDKDSNLAKAPLVIRDGLLFPYLAGTSFSQQFLKAHTGWADLHLVFEHPPVSTQQIMHPDLYLKDVRPVKVTLPKWQGIAPAEWKLLEENVMGEFGVEEVLKQFLDPARAARVAPTWSGDRYALFEDSKTKDLRLVWLLNLDSEDDAARFFGQYSEALEMKYPTRTKLFRRPNFFQFQTPTGGVYLRCLGVQCISVEGATRATYDSVNRAMGWPAAPGSADEAAPSIAQIPVAADRSAR